MKSSANLPKKFDELVDRSLLFKVESRNDQNFKLEQSFRVKKICVDDDIIEKFNDSSLKSVVRCNLRSNLLHYNLIIMQLSFSFL